MNLAEIDKEITKRLSECKSPEELREIQAWAKKAKKEKEIEPHVTEFIRIYYQYDVRHRGGSGSRARWTTTETFKKFSAIIMGFEVALPWIQCEFPETEFESKKIFIDRKIKWGGKSYYPKTESTEFFGMNILEMFWQQLELGNYFIFIGRNSAYLTNATKAIPRLSAGLKPLAIHLWGCQHIKIPKSAITFFEGKLEIKDHKII